MLKSKFILTPALMDKHGILKRFHNVNLSNYYGANASWANLKTLFYNVSERDLIAEWKEAQKIYQTVKFYIDNIVKAKSLGKGLFLYGNCGTGKSLLLMCIAKEALSKGMRIRVVTAQSLINLFAKSWDAEKGLHFESLIMKVPFLFVEELGKEHMTQIALPTLTRVVKYREEALLPTCFSCNEDFETIEKQYSASLASSIIGSCKLVHFDSSLDWRKVLQESWTKEIEEA
jgi:DNA replication protein DnaC